MTIIGPSLNIKGDVTSHEDVTVHGKVNGKLSVQTGTLLIAQDATVEAETHVGRLTIHGTFSGDIAAAERVELSSTANVAGTLVAPAIVIQDGAVFNGCIEVQRRDKSAAAKPAAPTPIAKAS